ncbi:hypothetical protein ECC02_005030 [Trypanosoma cruzi]|uniref:Uncharacterized protein n=1 Tax=Trypanosoma cruzi TaxID=5693 RepID=A0A7J6Y505_TRYCR|nr:hypothetical protein ECC02_005030 [Trypanosoma cruzi]
MMLSTEEIATITLKSPFVHEYGDTPYFRRCINEFSLQFFVRYRTSRDDPSQHRWSRLLEVVDRHTHGTDAASTSTTTKVAPLQWKEKLFFIALRVEGEEKCVELPRLSSKLPTVEEVMEYCARRAESQLQEGRHGNEREDVDSVKGVTARAQLPTVKEIAEMKAFRQNQIVNHHWTPDEVEAMREQNERLGRVGACSAPIRLTVTSLHNMRLETELGIASSRHMTGHTATAMERRSSTQLSLHGHANSPATSQSPIRSQSLRGSGASLADLTASPLPATPVEPSSLLSREVLQRWEESKRDAESFYAYVSDEHRSAYMKKIAQITLKNYERNKLDRLRGIANEKRLDRKGNLLESGGLWIVDDQVRAQLARMYQIEQDGETVTAAGGGDAKKNATEAPSDDTTTPETAPPALSEEDAMLQQFVAQRKAQELSFASVPEEFMSISDENRVDDKTEEVRRPPSSARSPELLLMDTSSRVLISQLLHKAASSMLKRPTLSCASRASSQTSVATLGGEPPKKVMRHA